MIGGHGIPKDDEWANPGDHIWSPVCRGPCGDWRGSDEGAVCTPRIECTHGRRDVCPPRVTQRFLVIGVAVQIGRDV